MEFLAKLLAEFSQLLLPAAVPGTRQEVLNIGRECPSNVDLL